MRRFSIILVLIILLSPCLYSRSIYFTGDHSSSWNVYGKYSISGRTLKCDVYRIYYPGIYDEIEVQFVGYDKDGYVVDSCTRFSYGDKFRFKYKFSFKTKKISINYVKITDIQKRTAYFRDF